jgi:hypothetical protein
VAGRLQKVAAIFIAASAFGKPVCAASFLDISGATAFERWNLTANAARTSWDGMSSPDPEPGAPRLVTRFSSRDAFHGDESRASLAFDWQRRIGRGRLAASVFAVRHGLELRSVADTPAAGDRGEYFEQRERRSLFGAAALWSGNTPLGGLPGTSRAGLRMRSESLDAEGLLGDAGRGPRDTLREDRLRQSNVGVHLDHELHIARGLRAAAGVRLDRYRFGVRSELAGNSGSAWGTQLASHFSLTANPTRDLELFAGKGRGLRPADAQVPGAAIDPRTGALLGQLDPASSLYMTEIGMRTRIFGVDTRFAAWRATADSELTLLAAGNSASIDRPTERQGLQATLRYQATGWLSLDLDAALLRARFADGPGEPIPGATRRYGQAGATVRPSRGWNASVFVTSFGTRPSTDDDPMRMRSATFVSGRVTRNLTGTTRVSLDLFNLLDKRVGNMDYFSATRLWSYPGAADNFLFHPGESRGLRLRLRTTF